MKAFFRYILAPILTLALFFYVVPVSTQAGTTGNITGHVIDSATHAPISGVKVIAASPSGSQQATTDSHGFYSFIGLNPDTYTISFQVEGYQPQAFQGITAFADQTTVQDAALTMSLKTIAHVETRSSGSAFQPTQPTNTYTVTAAQIQAIQGTDLNDNANQLMEALPGASASTERGGAVIVDAGRANQLGYTFDGIPLNNSYNATISITNTGNQSQNVSKFSIGNIIPTIGISQFQLTTGAGDVTYSNTGTGDFNLVPKEGTYPSFVDALVGVDGGDYKHALAIDFGTASPNGRWSEYAAFDGSNFYPDYGYSLTAQQANIVDGIAAQTDRSFINNLIYRWGKNNKYDVQLLYYDWNYSGNYDYGDNIGLRCYESCNESEVGADYVTDPDAPVTSPSEYCCVPGFTACPPGTVYGPSTLCTNGGEFSAAEVQDLLGLEPGQDYFNETLAQAGFPIWTVIQDRYGYKAEFDDRINPTTYFQLSGYESQTDQWSMWYANNIFAEDTGPENGITAELSKQLGQENFIKLGYDTSYQHPVVNFNRNLWGPEIIIDDYNTEGYDFINPDSYCLIDDALGIPSTGSPGSGYCGYLFQHGLSTSNSSLQAPSDVADSQATQWTSGEYISDEWTPTDRMMFDLGIREDNANYHYPAPTVDEATCTTIYLPTSWTLPVDSNGNPESIVPGSVCPTATFPDIGPANTPHVFEPRINGLFKLSTNDVIRMGYGRTFQWAPDSQEGTNSANGASGVQYSLNVNGPYSNVPSYDNPGVYCGLWGDYTPSVVPAGSPALALDPCVNSASAPYTGMVPSAAYPPGTSVGYYQFWNPFPCPAMKSYGTCPTDANWPYPPTGQPNPPSAWWACGYGAIYYVPCVNYQEQLNYDFINDLGYGERPPLLAPFVPTTYSNYNFSYEHFFPDGFGPGWLKDLTSGIGAKVTVWSRRGFDLQASESLPGDATVMQLYGLSASPLLNPSFVGTTFYYNAFNSQQFPASDYGVGTEWDNGVEVEITRQQTYGLSFYYSATLNHTVSNVPSSSDAFSGTVPGASLYLNELYPEGFVPKFSATFAPSYATRSGWRFSGQLLYSGGFPIGNGTEVPVFLDGSPSAPPFENYLVPLTNLSYSLSPLGTGGTSQYVDPLNPGSYIHPNIAATLGTPEGRFLNSVMSPPQSLLNLQIEKKLSPTLSIGVDVSNVWGLPYEGPELNTEYQPVATGISGPKSGTTAGAYTSPPTGYNLPTAYGGNQAYVNYPQDEGRIFYLYLSFHGI